MIAACNQNNYPLVSKLLSEDPKLAGIEDIRGNPVLLYAVRHNYLKMTSLLLNNSADPNQIIPVYQQGTIMHFAARNNSPSMMKLLILKSGNVNATDLSKSTLLHTAVNSHNDGCVLIILQNGANVNAQDSIGNTPLHAAILAENHKAITLLIKYGASLTIKDNMNETPIDLAKRINNEAYNQLRRSID